MNLLLIYVVSVLLNLNFEVFLLLFLDCFGQIGEQVRVVDRDFELGVHRASIRLDVARAIWFPRLERPSFISAITIGVLRVLHLALEKVTGVERAVQ